MKPLAVGPRPHHKNEVWKGVEGVEPVTTPASLPPLGGRRGVEGVERLALAIRGVEVTSLVLGIDVGQAGAAALLTATGDLLAVADLPVTPDGPRSRPTISGALLAELLRQWRPDRAFVELVGARPTDSRAGAFAFGMARGTVEATLATLGIPQRSITVPSWKRAIGIPAGTDQKSTARSEAIRRWPAHAASFARVKDDGRAEAALIALAGIIREARP